MTSKDLILQVRDALKTWAAGHGGTAEIAGDVIDVFQKLTNKPGSVRAVVWLRQEDKRGDFEETGVVDRTVIVFISRGRGFTLDPTDSLWLDTAGSGEPLFDLVEEARRLIRSMSLPQETTEATFDYKGYQPFNLATEQPVDAYQLEFSIGVQLPPAISSLAINSSGTRLAINNAGLKLRLN